VSGGVVQVAAGVDLALKDIGAITASSTDSQAAATALTYTINAVTSGADTHAVLLPAATTNQVRVVQVTTGAYAVKVYPASGDKINGGSANAAVVCKEATMQLFIPVKSDEWAWLGTVNS
jgi:hypothetical protein